MPAGFIQLATSDITVDEALGEVSIGLTRTDGSEGVATVDFSTASNSARDGEDYLGFSEGGTIEFAAGETEQSISIPLIDDNLVEGTEEFSFFIGEPTGAELGLPRTAIITIEDDDVSDRAAIAFDRTEYVVDEGAGEATVTLTRQGAIETAASVDFATIDDYARASGAYPDYLPVTQTVTFAPGETRQTVVVPILDDDLPEPADSLNLSLSNPVGVELGVRNTARLSIADDDEFPAGFSQELVVDGLQNLTDFDWLGDNRMVIAELDGRVRLYDETTGELTTFLDIRDRVNINAQRGLLSIAVHPNFPNNPYVYLGYASDPPGVAPDQKGPRDTLLVRVEADPSTGYATALPGSEVTLLTVPNAQSFHASGGLRFGTDGSLFWSHGDGTRVSVIEPRIDFFDLDNPLGKLYRIDPITGEGYTNNPFYTGNADDLESKIYSVGHRNPFRIAIHPETGEPYIGDVGQSTWEEINSGRGANFGWPFFEGGYVNGQGENLELTGAIQDPGVADLEITAPIYARNHSDGYSAFILGDFLTSDNYPEIYQDALVVATTQARESIDALLLDNAGNVDAAITLPIENDDGQFSKLSVGPDGNLYYATFGFISTSKIRRIVFDSDSSPTEPTPTEPTPTEPTPTEPAPPDPVLYRVNAGGPTIVANDGGPDWLRDNANNNSPYLLNPGSNDTTGFPAVEPGSTVDASVPSAIFNSERWDRSGGSSIQYAFAVPESGDYEVRLYFGNGFAGTSAPDQRQFAVALEGTIPENLNAIDPAGQFGHLVGGAVSNVVTVADGTLDVEFLHGEIENPFINGIEIVQLDRPPVTTNLTGQPDYDKQTEVGLFVWQDEADGTFKLRATGDADGSIYRGSVVSDRVIENPREVLLGDHDRFEISEDGKTLEFELRVWQSHQDGFEFSLAPGASGSLRIDPVEGEIGNPPLYVGAEKSVVEALFLDLVS